MLIHCVVCTLLASLNIFFCVRPQPPVLSFFFFNDTATTEIYTLSLHDALPICLDWGGVESFFYSDSWNDVPRSEEHTSELQSHSDLVCRLLLEKKKNDVDVEVAVGTIEVTVERARCPIDYLLQHPSRCDGVASR